MANNLSISREQLKPVASALANMRGGRNGVPPITNVLEMLEKSNLTKLVNECYEDAEAAIAAWEKSKETS